MRIFYTYLELRKAIKKYFNGKDTSDIGVWDTSQITNMSSLFIYMKQISIEPITLNWDTSNVTNMSNMFYHCKQDFILNFDTRNVTDMYGMFYSATNFNQPLNFDTSNVTNMSNMFFNATNFNQPLFFNTKNIKYITGLFHFATNYNQPNYFINNNISLNYVFDKSPLEGQENKYLLSAGNYYKLLLFYILNQINTELLFLCDEFEEFC